MLKVRFLWLFVTEEDTWCTITGMTQSEHWTCARRSRDLLEGLERTGKVILQESALDRREFTLFAAKTTHNGAGRNWRIVLRVKGDSFQTNYSQRPWPTADWLFHHSWRDHIFHNSRRWVLRLFSFLVFLTKQDHQPSTSCSNCLSTFWLLVWRLDKFVFSSYIRCKSVVLDRKLWLRSTKCTFVHAKQHEAFYETCLAERTISVSMLKCRSFLRVNSLLIEGSSFSA